MPSKAASLARSSHPGPSVAVTIIMVGLGIGAGLDPFRLTVLGLSMLSGQLSVGLSNDWIDAERDTALARKDKPIAQGWVGAIEVRNAALFCAALTIVLPIPLGWMAELLLVIVIGGAWAYNLWLKKTVFSIVPYLVGFGALPAIATLSRAVPTAPAPWSLGVGALLGAAAHFANTLPDLEGDAATGVRGLPHVLGRRWSCALSYCALLFAAILEFFGTGALESLAGEVGLFASVVIAGIGGAMILRPTRWHFRLIILAAMIQVVVLLFAGSKILG